MRGRRRRRKRSFVEEIDEEFEKLLTEQRNPSTEKIDRQTTVKILKMINTEDKKVPGIVEKEIPRIAEAVDSVFDSISAGGRLIYVGAGTSGRLGVIDAAECPPTFSTPPEMVQAIIAGGKKAVWRSVEGAEDDEEAGRKAVADKGVADRDTIIGLSASGRAPYVAGALLEAKERSAKTVAITTTPNARISGIADVAITPLVGPEAITGSTRMKAGTAEKLILNMITTAAMIRLGKTYGNIMIDLQPWSEKLRSRARRIIKLLAGVDSETAHQVFEESGRDLKTALVMANASVDKITAEKALEGNSGIVWKAIETLKRKSTKASHKD